MSAPRTHVLSATTSFDGTTPLPGAWQPKPDPDQPRLNLTVETVGRLSFKDLVRKGVTAALVLARVLDASSQLVMAQRTASTAEISDLVMPDDPVPLVSDAVITTVQLSAAWSAPLLLGGTDALTFTGLRNTAELMVFELGASQAALTLLTSVLNAVASTTPVTVVEINGAGALPAFAGRTYFLVDIPAGGVLTLPVVADVVAGSEAYFINIGGGTVLVTPDGVETLNDAASGVVQVAGFGGTYVARAGAGYVSTEPLILETVTIDNVVSGETQNLPPLTAQSLHVNLRYTANGDLLLPSASAAPKGFKYILNRTVGDSQIRLKTAGGGFLNGELNGVAYVPAARGGNGGAAAVVEASTYGWTVVGSNGMAPTPVTTVAVGDATLLPWGLDEIVVRLTEGAPQTLTLPATAAVPVGAKARVLAVGNDKTIAAVGADQLVGQAKPAAGTFAVLEDSAVLLINSGLEWIVN